LGAKIVIESADISEVLDQQALNNVRALQRPGNALLAKVIGIFLKDSPMVLTELQRCVDANDPVQMSKLAHRLKSGCANLGATRLAEQLRELEALGKAGSCEGARALFDQVQQEYPRVEQALKRELGAS
jgi:HPt (histidine-containing phosphotransfer) domain-containing protein